MARNRCSEVLQRFAQLIQALCPLWRFRALRKARLRALLESDAAVPAKASGAECDVSKGFPASGNRGNSDEPGPGRNVQSSNCGGSSRHAASSDSRGDSRGVRGDAGRHSMPSDCRGNSDEPAVASSAVGVASITVPSAIGMYRPGSCKAALARSASRACVVM